MLIADLLRSLVCPPYTTRAVVSSLGPNERTAYRSLVIRGSNPHIGKIAGTARVGAGG
jgi:hypothetical protein